MAAESVTIHIDSNNNGTAEYFNVVKDQKLVGQTTNELFRVQEDGNVGIGTTSPGEKLEVAGNISASGVVSASTLHIKDDNLQFEVGVNTVTSIHQSTGTHNSSDFLIIDKDNSDTRAALQVQGNNGSAEVLFAASSGKVGIGTTSPGEKLEVVGNISASGNITAVSMSGDGSGLTGVSATLPAGVVSSSAQIADVTLTTAAQTNITSLGTLTTLTVDNVTINGNQISTPNNLTIISTGGDVIIGSDEKQIDLQDGDDNTKFSFKTDSTPEMDVTGNFTIDCSSDITLDAAGKDISLTDGVGTAEFIFNLEAAPEIDVDGDFTIDGSGLIKLDSATNNIDLIGNVTASGNISSSGNVISDIIVTEKIHRKGSSNNHLTLASNYVTTIGDPDDSANQTKLVIDDGNEQAYFTSGDTDTFALGVNTTTPTDGYLEVKGNISASGNFYGGGSTLTFGHITASGNISASGNYIGNRRFEKTSTTDADHRGDIVYFGGTTSMTAGRIYHYKSDGTWEAANPNAASTSDGLLAVSLGTASDTDGMLLRGTVTLDHDPGAVGDVLYLNEAAAPSGLSYGRATDGAPAGNGDIVRVIGYCLDGSNGQIYFNPDNTFVEVST
jgi:hypothetical protein